MKKLGSVQYLRIVSNAILAFHEKFEKPQRDGQGVDKQKMEAAWDTVVGLAQEIKDTIGIIELETRKKKADGTDKPVREQSEETKTVD